MRLMRRQRPGWILYGLHWYMIAVVLTAAWIALFVAAGNTWIPIDRFLLIAAPVCALGALLTAIRGTWVAAKTYRLTH